MVSAQPVLDLMQKIIEIRHDSPVHNRLSDAGKCSMLHLDVRILAYHFARICTGDILEIGSFIGGSTIATALGIRASGAPKRFLSIEPGGRLDKHPLATKDIFKQLTKNLARFGVRDDVSLINSASYVPSTIATVRETFRPGSLGLFIFDADADVGRDLATFGDLLADDCWVIIDDYFGASEKAGPTQSQVNEWVERGRLITYGYYGWGTWVGRWRAP